MKPLDRDDFPANPELLQKRLNRERAAREEAEAILERRSRELTDANKKLAAREAELLKKLDEGNRHLLRAQRTAQLATVHIEADGRSYTSPEFARILGLPDDTAPQYEEFQRLVHPLDRERVDRVKMAFLTDNDAAGERTLEHRIRRRDGDIRWLRWRLRREDDDQGRYRSIFGTVQDVTEQRAAQRSVRALQLIGDRRVAQLTRLSEKLTASRSEVERAHRSKSDFLALMSHNIRTPLNGILGMFDLAADSSLNETQQKQLALAQDASRQLHRQLDTIIAAAQAEDGALPFEPETVDIAETLHSLAQFWKWGRGDIGARLQLRSVHDLPEQIETDPTKLRQVIDHFIERCAQFSGPILLSAKTDRDALEIRVECHEMQGAALDDELLRRLAGSLDAQLICETSSFGIRLKINEDDISKPQTPSATGHQVTKAARMLNLSIEGRRPRLLIVDDIEVNRLVLAGMLGSFGCDYEMAEDGEQAVELTLSGEFDAVLMDIRMPRMTGTEATHVIRANADAALASLPIVAVTAHVDADGLDELVRQGLTAALAKPIDRKTLFQTLEPLLTQNPGHSDRQAEQSAPEIVQSSAEVIDIEIFRNVFMALPPTRRDMLLNAAISDLDRLDAELEAAVALSDAKRTDDVAHSLKGVAGNFGATALLQAIARFRAAPLDKTAAMLPDLKNEIAAAREHGRDLFDQLGLDRLEAG